MTVTALRVVEPRHELTICALSSTGNGKVGSCSCGAWTTVGEDSDAISRRFVTHAPARNGRPALAVLCDCCQAGIAQVRNGSVDLCGACAADELERSQVS